MSATATLIREALEAYDEGDLDRLRELHTVSARVSFVGRAGDVDLDAWFHMVARVRSVLPDLAMEVVTVVADGTTAVAEVEVHGTNSVPIVLDAHDHAVTGGRSGTIPATGRSVRTPAIITFFSTPFGIAHERHAWPSFWLYEALGLVQLDPLPTALLASLHEERLP